MENPCAEGVAWSVTVVKNNSMLIFALIDCNSFYASCEKVFRPELRDKPVIVLSNNDGIIIARSKEAKDLGISMGEAYFKIKGRIEKLGVHVFSSNYALYGDLSSRVISVLEHFSPEVEIYSIDEAFIDLSGFERLNLTDYCRGIKERVKKWTGIPVSIGIAETKTLAKVANRIAKKFAKTEGVLNLTGSAYLNEALKRTEIEDLWGVGRRWGKRLRERGIDTAFDLKKADEYWIKKEFGIVLMRTVLELRGQSCILLECAVPSKQGITSSRSFGRPVEKLSEMKAALSSYITRAAEKLRKQNSVARSMTVYVRTNRFKKDNPQYSGHISIELPVATADTRELICYGLGALERIYREGYCYQKTGVMLNDLIPADQVQMNLFDKPNFDRSSRAMKAIDGINGKMGADAVKSAALGIGGKWQMRRNMMSPRYTTQWGELACAK